MLALFNEETASLLFVLFSAMLKLIPILVGYFIYKNIKDNWVKKEKPEPEYIYDCGVKLKNPFYKPETDSNNINETAATSEEKSES